MNKSDVKKFLDLQENHIIQIKEVNDGKQCYRVNIYDKQYIDGRVIPTTKLINSVYLCIENNQIVDRTIKSIL